MIEERKQIRANNREMRLREAVEKRRKKEEERSAKQVNTQLQHNIKQAKKKCDETVLVEQDKGISVASTVEEVRGPSDKAG